MARKSTGSIVTKQTSRGTSFGIRFRANGRSLFVHVGYAADGITQKDAQRDLDYVLEQVRRGEWTAAPEPEPAKEMPTFHMFASEWLADRIVEGGRDGGSLSPRAEEGLRWQLELHLLPAFAKHHLDEIDTEAVDRWRRAKVREGRLCAGSINTCLRTLAAILELAVEYGYIERNPARGKRRRLPVSKAARNYLDSAESIAALLDAAATLDERGRAVPYRRALLAVLTLGGLRIDEALSLRWKHVHLPNSRLRVPGTKTAAAKRTITVLPLLRDELSTYAAATRGSDPEQLVFGTPQGRKHSQSNVRRRVLTPATTLASERLVKDEFEPLPENLTPNSLRRTFASVLYALGHPPPRVMSDMGHTSPNLALAVYARDMARTEGDRERLRDLVEGLDWAPMGTRAPEAVSHPGDAQAV